MQAAAVAGAAAQTPDKQPPPPEPAQPAVAARGGGRGRRYGGRGRGEERPAKPPQVQPRVLQKRDEGDGPGADEGSSHAQNDPISAFQKLLVFIVESAAVVAAAAWQLELHDVIIGLDKQLHEQVAGVDPFGEVLQKRLQPEQLLTFLSAMVLEVAGQLEEAAAKWQDMVAVLGRLPLEVSEKLLGVYDLVAFRAAACRAALGGE